MCGRLGSYEDCVMMPVRGRVVEIDRCISHIVAALNAANLTTVASCCGHGIMPGRITLEDGRELLVTTTEEAQAACERAHKRSDARLAT